jgi:hypothetical protein
MKEMMSYGNLATHREALNFEDIQRSSPIEAQKYRLA